MLFLLYDESNDLEPVTPVEAMRDGDLAVVVDGGYAGDLVLRSSDYLISLTTAGRVWNQRPLPPLNVRKVRLAKSVTLITEQ